MLQVLKNSTDQQGPWLKPLTGQNRTEGMWMLSDIDTRYTERRDATFEHINVNDLLQLLAQALGRCTIHARYGTASQATVRSECRRFEARWTHNEGEATRLFVQRRSDRFSCIQLRIDQHLVATFSEPVWPHLQRKHRASDSAVYLPADCLDVLRTSAEEYRQLASNKADNGLQTQINAGPGCDPYCDTIVAAA